MRTAQSSPPRTGLFCKCHNNRRFVFLTAAQHETAEKLGGINQRNGPRDTGASDGTRTRILGFGGHLSLIDLQGSTFGGLKLGWGHFVLLGQVRMAPVQGYLRTQVPCHPEKYVALPGLHRRSTMFSI